MFLIAVAVAPVSRVATCLVCGEEFEDRSRTAPRTYCYDCKPPGAREPRRSESPVVVDSRVKGDPFTVEHFCRWAHELLLDNYEPWRVEDFFARFLEDFLAGGPGEWVYPETWLLVPEGNTKTTSMSGVALYHLDHMEYGMSLWAAAARDQAELGYLQAEGFVMRSPRLQGIFRCYQGYRRIQHRSNGSRLQIFAADDRTGDGVIPTQCLLDELHRQRNLKLYRTWRGKLLKRGGQLGTFSTSGEPGSEFEVTRTRIRQEAEVVERARCFTRAVGRGVAMHDYSIPEDGDPEDMELVKAANPFSGITVEQLREKFESPTMTLPHWSRFVCNVPTRDVASAITEREWAERRSGEHDDIPAGEPIWAGLDLAFKWDTTALVPLWWRDAEYRLLGRSRILVPPRTGDSLDSHLIEKALVEVHERNPIHTIVVDRSKAEQLCQWIEETLGCVVVERAQTNSFAVADYEMWMEALSLGHLQHVGDPGLTQHVLNATARVLPGGDTRFDRPAPGRGNVAAQEQRVIDALTAASQVHSEAVLSTRAESLPVWQAV